MKQWEAIGMSRATWYRRGKPTEKTHQYIRHWSHTRQDTGETECVLEFSFNVPLREAAKAVGVSVRTLQRDRAAIRRQVAQEIRKRRASGQEMSADEIEGVWKALEDAKLRARVDEARDKKILEIVRKAEKRETSQKPDRASGK
jgi:hypothetical protein